MITGKVKHWIVNENDNNGSLSSHLQFTATCCTKHTNQTYYMFAGFVVGQAGLYQSIVMFLVAYFIVTMTVLSICAISTNGALEAGGAYRILYKSPKH